MSGPRVAVVGGGLAGSLAALVLRSRGLRATVLEARPRPGGRLDDDGAGAHFMRASDPASQWAAVLGRKSPPLWACVLQSLPQWWDASQRAAALLTDPLTTPHLKS